MASVQPVLAKKAEPTASAERRVYLALTLGAAAFTLVAVRIYLGTAPYRPLGFDATGRFMVGFLAYLAAARAALDLPRGAWRNWAFAIANVGGVALLIDWHEGRMKQLFFLSTLFGIVCFHYVAMRLLARRGGWWPWAAFLSPIAFLLAIRHVALIQTTLETLLPSGIVTGPLLAFYTGISYLSFRLSRLVVEVRNETVPQPGLAQYLGYAFFVPTFVVGPISSYNAHYSSIARPSRDITPIDRSLLRLVVGLTKYQFLGNLFNQLAYQQFLLDGHAHAPLDLLVSAVAYHLYLYCNFSGFCDMAIGAAGLLQVRVQENFRNPFAARNLQEYWSRWHITLSSWMRELVFAPLSKYLVGKWGSRNLPHAAGVSIAVVFLLVGIWHGVGWQYAAFGAAHAAALTAHHYYNLWLKRILSKEAYRAYQSNRWVNAAGIAITFACTTSFLFLFANDFAAAQKILAAIRF